MRFPTLLPTATAFAGPALPDEPPVVVLGASSAPPTPWYEPPPEPKVVVQPVYVPLCYLPLTYGPSFHRKHLAPSAKRNR